VARPTQRIKRETQSVQNWIDPDQDYSVGEFRVTLLGWQTERRFLVIREMLRERRDSVGRKPIRVPGYTFQIFVTNSSEAPPRSAATTICAPWKISR
jgi:hypothetical protein